MSSAYNPLPGPQPYTGEDRRVFFGREAMTLKLGDAILSQRVLTVFGPSGAGKSSLLRAGVVPYLVEGWDVRPVIVDAWPPEQILHAGPVQRLAEGISEALDLGETLSDLEEALRLAARRSDRPVLLVLDQLEQLLVHHELPVLQSFIAALHALRGVEGLGLHVVLSLREDYLGRWTALLRPFPPLIRHSFRVPRLNVADMTHAVIRAAGMGRPAQTWRKEVLTPLIGGMSLEGEWRSDAAEVESAYVQIVCRALWEQGGPREDNPQTPAQILESYLGDTLRGLGRLEGPARHLLEERLITRTGARIPITRTAALEEVPHEEELDRILTVLEGARILRAQEHHGDRFFELGHDWLAKPILGSALQRRQAAAERLARRNRRIQTGVLVLVIGVAIVILGLYLQSEGRRREAVQAQAAALAARTEAERARDQAQTARDQAEVARTDAVAAQAQAEAARDQEARERLAAEEARQEETLARADADRARAQAIDSARFAKEQETVARGAASRAMDTLHMLAVRDLSHDPTREAPFLLGVTDPAQYARWRVELLHVLQRPLALASWQDKAGDAPTDLRFSPDGGTLATAFSSGRVVIRGAEAGALLRTLEGHTRAVRALRWSPDGRSIATASEDGTARIWSVSDGGAVVLRGHGARVWSLAWSPDGSRLATTSEDGTARIWSPEGGEASAVLRHDGPVWSVAWSPRGDALVTASADGTARRWSGDGTETGAFALGRSLFQAAWLPDASRVLFGAADQQSWLWLEGARAVASAVLKSDDYVVQVVASPDGRLAATRTRGGEAVAWAVPDSAASAPRAWPLGEGRVASLRLGGQAGQQVALALRSGPAELLEVDAGGRPKLRRILEGQDNVLAIDQHGDRVATVSTDGAGRIWPASVRGLSSVLGGVDGSQVAGLAFSSDGQTACLRLLDGEERAVSARGEDASVPEDVRWSNADQAQSPDGEVSAAGARDGRIRLIFAGAADAPAVLDEHAGAIRALAWSPAGDALLSASDDGTVRWWSLPSLSDGLARLRAEGVGCVAVADRRHFLGETPEEAQAGAAACAARTQGASR